MQLVASKEVTILMIPETDQSRNLYIHK